MFTNSRTLRDLALLATLALPAAGATNFTAGIDTCEVNPGRSLDVELLVELPATPALAAGQTITLTVQDSADGANFAAVADLPPIVVTSAGAGGAAVERRFKLPIGTRRHLRLQQAASATAGNNTAVVGSIGFVF
jgi:hypothetical protein